MSDENNSTDLKRDELPLTSAASDIQADISSEKAADRKIHSKAIYELPLYSSVLGSADPLSKKAESHSVILKTYAVAKRYKITLAQARRMALNAAKKAKRRRERALENEADIEDSADRQE